MKQECELKSLPQIEWFLREVISQEYLDYEYLSRLFEHTWDLEALFEEEMVDDTAEWTTNSSVS